MLNKFKIGHFTKSIEGTGVTVIIAEDGAVGGVSVRGSAPATRETDLLRPGNSVNSVNAVVLSGGSAFGLDGCGGVMQYLKEKNIGYPTAAMNVPIVCGASLYDLEYLTSSAPTAGDGYSACCASCVDNFESGNIGAGTGATVGKMLGAACSEKGGLGVCYKTFGEVEIACIVAVNAFGNVYDIKTSNIIAGVNMGGKYIDIVEAISSTTLQGVSGANTTIGCVITNAKLTKEQANKLADIAHDGYAMAIRPVHTMVDGDAIFAMASCEVDCDFMMLSCIAPTMMATAINNAIKQKQ